MRERESETQSQEAGGSAARAAQVSHPNASRYLWHTKNRTECERQKAEGARGNKKSWSGAVRQLLSSSKGTRQLAGAIREG